jgi:O-antigen ligase
VGKKRQRRAAATAAAAAAARPARDSAAILVAAILCAVLAGTALAVDTLAAAAFDAPKRLIAVLGTALAAAVWLGLASTRRGKDAREIFREAPRLARWAAVLAAVAVALGAIAAAVSPRRAIALDSLRTIAVLLLLLPLGASRVFPKGRAALTGVFLGAASLNAVVSVLQARGLYSPFRLETFGARQETGAFAGNVGYLAIVLAIGIVVALGILLDARRPLWRVLAGAALLLFAAGLVVNQNLTALMALLAGSAVLLVLRFRRRAALPLAACVIAVGVAVAAYPPLRFRARELAAAVRTRNWDALVSFRGGPWAAALEMTRERPLVGFGPGTFASEYVPHRLAAEIRAKRRYVSPLITSSYAEAHSDYLQVASDAGVPAGLAAAGAAACLLAAIGGIAWRRRSPEAIVLAAVLATGAAAALTWFPLQRPITAVPLLLAAGRAWRLAAESTESEAAPEAAA